MTKLFNKAILFGDIHFGNKNNSKIFNQDCEDFIDWLLIQKEKLNAETCIFLGDWFHNRRFINIHTLDSSLRSMQKINDAFEQIFFIVGNHDLYYKDKRDVTSLKIAEKFDKIKVFYDIEKINNCLFVPWLVENEWKKIENYSVKYVFGHFELPRFLMNSYMEMPDKGELTENHLQKNEWVFSGHFHKRQKRKNIHYIGNCFPHNYADINDFERGITFLEWDKEPVYLNWENMPYYTKLKLSEALKIGFENFIKEKAHVKLILDVDVTYEESLYLKEKLIEDYNCREIQLIPVTLEVDEVEWEEGEIKTVDQMVLEGLKSLENLESNLDVEFLVEIYNNLDVEDLKKNI